MERCLCCYKPLKVGQVDYHPACARKLFGTKVPMEDMCQLSERLTEYKYKGSYEQIAKLIKKYSAFSQLDLVNFWEVVIFSWITGNADMHQKNFSLNNNRKMGYALTPAYDLLSTKIVMPEDTEELALTLNGKKRKIQQGKKASRRCSPPMALCSIEP